jgi:hypothetical protein
MCKKQDEYLDPTEVGVETDLFGRCGVVLPETEGPPDVTATVFSQHDVDAFVDDPDRYDFGPFADDIGVMRECQHIGGEVPVGPYLIRAGGTRYLKSDDLTGIDTVVNLTNSSMPFGFRARYRVLALPLRDYGGVPPDWREGVMDVIRLLRQKQRVLAFCEGGHGRTGTLLASLVALLEDPVRVPDPIAEVRRRYCELAVETEEQAEAVFALRDARLPDAYRQEFAWQKVRRLDTEFVPYWSRKKFPYD